MADEAVTEAAAPEVTIVETEKENSTNAPQEMDLETAAAAAVAVAAGNGGKRGREEEGATESSENGGELKKPKVDEEKSLEEKELKEEATKDGPVKVGYKSFENSVEMFDYFFKLLHFWPPNLNINKYEHEMLLELLKKGHAESGKKIGSGVAAFQVRYHPQWKSRCYFIVREDETSDDFSFRKCVDHILPLPENMQVKSDVNKALGGGSRGGGRGNWRGRGGGGSGGGRGRGGGKPKH